MTRYDYNPQKAKDLLREAGWTPGADGILVKDGKPFKLRLYYAGTVVMFEQIAVIVQRQYRDVGVSVELNVENWATLMNRLPTPMTLISSSFGRYATDVYYSLRPYQRQ